MHDMLPYNTTASYLNSGDVFTFKGVLHMKIEEPITIKALRRKTPTCVAINLENGSRVTLDGRTCIRKHQGAIIVIGDEECL